jgi:hypothetical protein
MISISKKKDIINERTRTEKRYIIVVDAHANENANITVRNVIE